MSKKITMLDIARRAKVTRATVSYVLNGRWEKNRISPATRDRVLEVIKECNYKPDATARALVSKQTNTIGYILADNVDGGWLNSYYAAQMSGVEETCHRRGYSLHICRYNLSNLEEFVFPEKVGQRSVDGVILTGPVVEAEVVKRFREFGIPTICIGQDTEMANVVPTVDSDCVQGLVDIARYLRQKGHRRLLYGSNGGRRAQELMAVVKAGIETSPDTSDCEIEVFVSPTNREDFSAGGPVAEYWLRQDEESRATAVIASDQMITSMLQALTAQGVSCPGELSLVSSCDTLLCNVAFPPLTAMNLGLEALGSKAAELLIGSLEGHVDLSENRNYASLPCSIVERASVRDVS